MVDTMVAGGSPDLYYEYYQYQDMQQHLCPLRHEYGPVTVPMVSTNSSPPIAMPVQVPHGHVVQQIVDERGTLRHVILSPQHPPPMVPMPQHYGAANPNATNQPGGYYAGAMPHGYGPFSPLQPGVLGPHPQGHSPPPLSFHKDERTQRQYNKLKRKLEQKQLRENHLTTPPLSPRKELNGNSQKGIGSVGTSEDGEESSSLQDEEEDVTLITDLLATIKAPQVSEVTSRTALVQWCPPQIENSHQELKYEVLLSDRGKEGKYKSIYRGEALSCRIEDLRPGTEYCVCVSARLDNIVGCASEPTALRTPPCRPDPPPPPKLSTRTKNALTLKWQAAQDNGSHIDHYIVERDVNSVWTEVSRTKSKQAHIAKLQPATPFTFRIAAVNQFGKSDYSLPVVFETCDSPPPQPAPPTLTHSTPTSLTLVWASRPSDDDFSLQMEDPESRHGYLVVYNGKETSYTMNNLRKNTLYKFRLKSQNDEGASQWSEEVTYRTLPGRPSPPPRPQLKGRTHSHCFRLKWDPPLDKGGAPITSYVAQIMQYDRDSDWQVVYTGPNSWCTVERLMPGTAYHVRVACEGPGGASDFSEPALLATEAVCPGQCAPPRLQGKPRPRAIALKWAYPDNDGGAPVTELEVGMRMEGEELRTAYRGRETECLVGDLQPAHVYTFVVRASNKVGAGPWSDSLEVESSSAAPDRPDPPTLTATGGGGISCSWAAPPTNGSPLSHYLLQMTTPPCEVFNTVYNGTANHCEVKPVPPATLCVFRLQACNAVGPSDWSELATVYSSAGVPGLAGGLKGVPGPTSITLSWLPPPANGDPITHYTVEAGDVSTTAIEPPCTIENLAPATSYKVRVRGVNGVGTGAVASLKLSTLPLPPKAPPLSCTTASHNYLKLRWGAPNSNVHNHTYTLSMITPSNRKTIVYEGTATSHKVSRLQEQTEYRFTLAAANSTGKGPESQLYHFFTVIAPPPQIKGVKVSDIGHRNCTVEWPSLRPQGSDMVEYTVQCTRLREQSYKLVYRGKESRCEVGDLEPGADYLVRVGAVRVSESGPVEGAFCPPLNLSTPALPLDVAPAQSAKQHNHQMSNRKPLTDQQWAGIILCCFTVLAVLFAVIIAHIIY